MLLAVFSRSSLAVHGRLLGYMPGAAGQAGSAGRAGISGIRDLVQLSPAASQLLAGSPRVRPLIRHAPCDQRVQLRYAMRSLGQPLAR